MLLAQDGEGVRQRPTCTASSSRGCHSRYSDLTCTIITSVVDSILLAGVGAVAALRKKTRSGAMGRADAGQTKR